MPVKKTAAKKHPDRALQELRITTKQLRELNSFKRNFAMSLVKGVGATLGATLVAGILLTLLYRVYTSSVTSVPLLEKILPKSAVEPYFNR